MFAVVSAILLTSATMVPQPPARTEVDPGVEKARGLSYAAFRGHLRELGSEKKLKELMAILKSDLPGSYLAATEIVEALEAEAAVAFCKSLTTGSQEWESAFCALSHHPKDKVIGYIKQTATSPNRVVRAHCYYLCGRMRWDDLVDLATRDLTDDRPLTLPNEREIPTLGKKAKRYLDRVLPPNPRPAGEDEE